ncbi:phage baseplate protein [Methylobacterium komagatae]
MAGGIGAIVAYLGPNSRSIGTIIPDVVIQEAHRDALIITQHPVEKGSAITDHAFRTPSSVVIRCGFSNSSAGYEGYARQVYQQFLAWEASRDPRDVSTGKRLYRNMLPAEISVATDPRTENVLMITVLCQEVIITSTQRTGTDTSTTKPGDGSGSQGDPASTGSTLNGGSQQGQSTNGQSFAGAFLPGSDNAPGFSDNPYGFGSGFSPPAVTGDVGPITVQDGSTGNVIFDDSAGTNPIFGPGAIGGP